MRKAASPAQESDALRSWATAEGRAAHYGVGFGLTHSSAGLRQSIIIGNFLVGGDAYRAIVYETANWPTWLRKPLDPREPPPYRLAGHGLTYLGVWALDALSVAEYGNLTSGIGGVP